MEEKRKNEILERNAMDEIMENEKKCNKKERRKKRQRKR